MAIAWAEPSESTSALARPLGTIFFAAYYTRRRIEAAGGRWRLWSSLVSGGRGAHK